jgi:hypothetical protein
MSPAGNWSEERSGKFSVFLGITYIEGSVALEGDVVNLYIRTVISSNSPTLEVACPPPRELEQKSTRKHLKTASKQLNTCN